MRISLLPVSVVLLLCAACLVPVREARAAESVTLRSGRTLSLQSFEFQQDGLVIERVLPQGRIAVRLAFRNIEPTSLDALFHEHAQSLSPDKRLELADLAMRADLPRTAEVLFAVTSDDPTTQAAAAAGVTRARRTIVERTLQSLVHDVQIGGEHAALRKRVTALRAGPYADTLTPAERLRLVALDRLIAPKPVFVAPPPAAVAQPAGVVALGAVPAPVQALQKRLDAARRLRDRAANPATPAAHVLAFLERAALDLRRTRDAIPGLPVGTPPHLRVTLDREVTELLVATLVAVADLHRQSGRFDKARAHVRSALLVRPEHAGALQQRALIEEDLVAHEAAQVPAYDPYDVWGPYGRGYSSYRVGPYYSPYYRRLGHGHRSLHGHSHRHHVGHSHRAHGHGVGFLGFTYHHHGRRGGRRVVGYRR